MPSSTCEVCGETWPVADPAYLVACPDCGVRAGARCKRPSGHRVKGKAHASREIAALAAGVLRPCPMART